MKLTTLDPATLLNHIYPNQPSFDSLSTAQLAELELLTEYLSHMAFLTRVTRDRHNASEVA